MEKPITIIIEETKSKIANALNESELHPYVMSKILEEIHTEVNMILSKQIENDKKAYECSKEEEKATE